MLTELALCLGAITAGNEPGTTALPSGLNTGVSDLVFGTVGTEQR